MHPVIDLLAERENVFVRRSISENRAACPISPAGSGESDALLVGTVLSDKQTDETTNPSDIVDTAACPSSAAPEMAILVSNVWIIENPIHELPSHRKLRATGRARSEKDQDLQGFARDGGT
jgi:hypothetical protein